MDGCKENWVAVELENGRFTHARLFNTVEQVINAFPDAKAYGIDVPISYPRFGPRLADTQARAKLGARGRSVFDACPKWAIDLDDYEDVQRHVAKERARGRDIACPNRQSWSLRKKMKEAVLQANADRRLHEVHPEVSFWAMRGGMPVDESKRTWNGFWMRRRLLERQSIHIPDTIETGDLVGIDDVLDAAACAWTANRIAERKAESFPTRGDEQPDEHGRPVAIWY